MKNWRMLEAECEAILRQAGIEIDVNKFGDKVLIFTDDGIPDLNLTEFVKELADRVTLNDTAIQAKT